MEEALGENPAAVRAHAGKSEVETRRVQGACAEQPREVPGGGRDGSPRPQLSLLAHRRFQGFPQRKQGAAEKDA